MDEYPWEINHLTSMKLIDFFILIVYITHIKVSTLNPNTSISYITNILMGQQECVL